MYFGFVIFVEMCSSTSFIENNVNLEAKVVNMVRGKFIDLSRILHGCMHICRLSPSLIHVIRFQLYDAVPVVLFVKRSGALIFARKHEFGPPPNTREHQIKTKITT
jgi:hypothetical protein